MMIIIIIIIIIIFFNNKLSIKVKYKYNSIGLTVNK